MDVEELRDMELADGDSRAELRFGRGEAAGDSVFAFPSTLPPPSFLPDMISSLVRRVGLAVGRDREVKGG